MARLACTLSLDLDDAWTYMRAAGREGWEDTPTVVPQVCERLLDLLSRHDVRFTLFVIAKDLEDPTKLAAIRTVADAGHEIGCHSYMHEPTFAALDPAHMRDEVLEAQRLIEDKLGVTPTGFRAPGFAFSKELPPILREGGFVYDGSFLPTFLGPVARAYYFFKSDMSAEEKQKRKAMYGGIKDAFGPLKPRPHAGGPDDPPLLNIPVTTMPLLRAPFHFSYVLWLAGKWRWLARRYLGLGLGLCRLRGVAPSYLLHSLDFVGHGEHPDLDFFPGMDVGYDLKSEMLEHLMGRLKARFDVQPMGPWCERQLAAATA